MGGSRGLRIIGSQFSGGKERSHQILLEALGIKPFLGEEVLVGPKGEELDLYHSLFYHDAQAQFTDDFVHIVGKGLAGSKLDAEGNVVRRLPYGKHYTGLTEAGLTRENGYVANYGEAANYVLSYYYKTLNHAGDEEINDDILKAALKSIHARGFTRYSSLDDAGKRVMRAEQVTDERNSGLIGFPAFLWRENGPWHGNAVCVSGNDNGPKRAKIQRSGVGQVLAVCEGSGRFCAAAACGSPVPSS